MKYLKRFSLLESDNVMMSKNNVFISGRTLKERGVKDSDEILKTILFIDKTVDKKYSPIMCAFYSSGVSINDLDRMFAVMYEEVLEECRMSFDYNKLKVNYSDGKSLLYEFTKDGFENLKSDIDYESLNFTNNSISWFSTLPIDKKEEYIKRGHLLTDEQFDALL